MKYANYIKATILTLTCVTTFTAFAQNAKNINVSNFNAINVNSGIDLHLNQGTTETVLIKGDADVIKNVVVEQKNQSITIKYKNGVSLSRLLNGNKIDVYVTFKNLNAISASGGSDVDNTGTIKSNKMAISTSGGSDIELNIVCKNLAISTSGGSDVDLKGSAENMSISASGGSDVDAYGLRVNYAQVNTSGGSDVNLYVEKGLTASATGGSDITYKGNAALKRTSTSKTSDIKHIN